MDVLCYTPREPDQRFVDSIRTVMDVRYHEGLCAKPQTIQYVSLEDALAARPTSCRCM